MVQTTCLLTRYKNVALLIYFVIITVCQGLTDDIENNDGQVEKKDIFKLKKYNAIWSRAISRNLPEDKLHSLKRILNKLDRTELDVKHSGNNKEPKRNHLLNEVLREYGLLEHDVPILDHEDIHFNDARVNHLWQQALEEGHFSKHELNSLHKEMRHLENRMDEVHALNKETVHLQGKVANGMESDPRNYENLVEPTDRPDLEATKLDEMHAKLKEKKAKLSEQVQFIEEKVRNKANVEKSEFTDDRVSRLWNSVQNSSFTTSELLEVKEELRHFQKYIDKLQHWERFNKDIGKVENKEDQMHAAEKLAEYRRKVKKYHNTMIKKMKEYRVEL